MLTIQSLLSQAFQLARAGQISGARALLQQAERQSQGPEIDHCWARVLMIEGDRKGAIERFRRYLKRIPDDFQARSSLATLLALDGRRQAARRDLAEAVSRAPPNERALVYTEYGNALVDTPDRDEAIQAYIKAVELRPDHAPMRLNLASALALDGRRMAAAYHTTLVAARDASVFDSEDPTYVENLLMGLLCASEDPTSHRRQAARLAALRSRGVLRLPPPPPPAPDTPLRVGYVSPDFRQHAVTSFFAPVLAAHDRSRLRIHLYGEVASPDAITERLKGMVDSWVSTVGMDAAALAARIRADAIDVLIDLAGLTAGGRLDAFAYRPARVQLTWIGYPATTGIGADGGLDGRITDAWADPAGLTESHFSEPLLRLSTGFIAFRPLDEAPPVASGPVEKTGALTFGSFNNAAKISGSAITLWARTVNAVPGSRLVLKNHALADPFIVRELRGRFIQAGLAGNQLELKPATSGYSDHMSAYRDIDIALDTFPYHGTTTTCEALWMGVPVLTLAGKTHVSRVGCSLLSRLGLSDWIAEDEGRFVAKAAAFAQDQPMLSGLRKRLRPMMVEAPLFDPAAIARELETLYQDLLVRNQ